MVGARDLESTRVGLAAKVDDLEVIDDEGVAAGTLAKAHSAEVGGGADALGELEVEVGGKDDFVLGLVLNTPGRHDEGVVLGEDDDLVYTLGLEGVDLLDVWWDVVDVASGYGSAVTGQKAKELRRMERESVSE